MHLLCDQNVDQRYIDACVAAPEFTVVTVREALDPRATDPDIAAHAAAHGYVVLTSDDDFFRFDVACGGIFYEQTASPAVGDMLAALRAIRDAYDDYSVIIEVIPGGRV